MSDLFDLHLKLIAAGSPGPSLDERLEWDRAQSLRLPPLQLAARQPVIWTGPFAMAALIFLALFVARPKTDTPVLQFKGAETKVWVKWQRDGRPLTWSRAARGISGDRYQAEITSATDAVAFLAVTDKSGKLLSDPGTVVGNSLPLKAGERATFNQGFELTGENEGEVMSVIVCNTAKTRAVMSDLSDCPVHNFPLR